VQANPARCAGRATGDAKARRHTGFYTHRHTGFYTHRHTGFYTHRHTGFYTHRHTGGSNTPFNAGDGNTGGIDPRSERNASRARGLCKCRAEGSCGDGRWR
jgi:hypothetical protein